MVRYFRDLPEWWEETGRDLEPMDSRPDPTPEEAHEMAAEDFRRLPPRARAKARRMAKRSTGRRMENPEWYARQRREDVNAQVIF